MNPRLRRTLFVTGLGAAGGVAFLFLCLVLGIGQPDLYGNRGTIGTCVFWFFKPCMWFGDWAVRQKVFRSDNVLVGLAVMFAYSALVGAIVALACYRIRRLLLTAVAPKQ
jgi:hypothetical protein